MTDELRRAVLAGQFQPGERLQEVRLGALLQASRTPVRLALQALAADGLLEYAPNRGYTVRSFDSTELLNAFDIRAALEGLAAGFAARRGLDASERAEIESVLAQGDTLLAHGELEEASRPAYVAVNASFHEALHRAARSRMANEMLRIAFEYAKVRRRHDDHHRILDAVLRRDAGQAEALMRDHVASIKAGLSGQDLPQDGPLP